MARVEEGSSLDLRVVIGRHPEISDDTRQLIANVTGIKAQDLSPSEITGNVRWTPPISGFGQGLSCGGSWNTVKRRPKGWKIGRRSIGNFKTKLE